MTVRLEGKAQPQDILGAKLSKGAQRYWDHLCDRRDGDNLACVKVETSAKSMRYKDRTIRLFRAELLSKGWICLPKGDAGGRPKNLRSQDADLDGTYVHLHRDGQPCNLPQAECRQRTEAANANRAAANKLTAAKRAANSNGTEEKAEKISAFERLKSGSVKAEIDAEHIRNDPSDPSREGGRDGRPPNEAFICPLTWKSLNHYFPGTAKSIAEEIFTLARRYQADVSDAMVAESLPRLYNRGQRTARALLTRLRDLLSSGASLEGPPPRKRAASASSVPEHLQKLAERFNHGIS